MSDDRVWAVFTAGIIDILGVLGSHDVVAFSAKSTREVDDPFALTFGSDAAAGELRAYATGPASEPEPLPLSAEQESRLLELGWSPPDLSADGVECNTHFLVHPFPFDAIESRGRVAAMLVATPRSVYGFHEPEEVELIPIVSSDAVSDGIASLVELVELFRAPP